MSAVYQFVSSRGTPRALGSSGLKLTQERSAGRPICTPDVERIAFGVGAEGSNVPDDIHWVRAGGSGEIEALTAFDAGEVLGVAPTRITPYERTLIFNRAQETAAIVDSWVLPLDGEHTLSPLLQRGFRLARQGYDHDSDTQPSVGYRS